MQVAIQTWGQDVISFWRVKPASPHRLKFLGSVPPLLRGRRAFFYLCPGCFLAVCGGDVLLFVAFLKSFPLTLSLLLSTGAGPDRPHGIPLTKNKKSGCFRKEEKKKEKKMKIVTMMLKKNTVGGGACIKLSSERGPLSLGGGDKGGGMLLIGFHLLVLVHAAVPYSPCALCFLLFRLQQLSSVNGTSFHFCSCGPDISGVGGQL